MKKIISGIIAFLFIFTFVFSAFGTTSDASAKVYFASPDGAADALGTEESPLEVVTALALLRKGDTLKLLPGRYEIKTNIAEDGTVFNNGTIFLEASGDAHNYITVENASDTEKVIIDFKNQTFGSTNRGITVKGNYWHLIGLDVTNAGDNGVYISGSYNIVENCEFYANRDSGLQLGRGGSEQVDINEWPHNNLIKNCTSWGNYDDETYGENADGFAAKLTVGYGNVFDGCIAYNNCDDGWDLYAKIDSGNIGTVFLYNCVSFANGYLPDGTVTRDGDGIGFKLGGSTMVGDAYLVNCVAFNNRLHGFSDNSNPGVLSLINCTSYNNSIKTIETIDEDGNIVRKIDPNLSGDGSCNNFDLARTKDSYNNFYGLLSYCTNAGSGTLDAFRGSMAYSIMHMGGTKYNQVKDYIEASSYDNSAKGSSYTGLNDNSFKQVQFGSYDATMLHHTLRNEDKSINLGNMLALSETSELNTFADGNPIGGVLNKTSWDEYSHLEFTTLPTEYTNDFRTVQGAYDILRVICDNNAVYQDIVLPLVVNECNIKWESSDTSVITIGTKESLSVSKTRTVVASVLRDRNEAKMVTLKATITKGTESLTKEFTLRVMKDKPALGQVVGLENKYIVDQFAEFEEPKVSVSNASSNSGRLLEEGLDKDFVVEKMYEYAKDKNSKFFPVSKIYTGKAGVYRVTYTIKSNMNEKDVKQVSYLLYVANSTGTVDFVNNKVNVNLTADGVKVAGSVSSVTGNIYVLTTTEQNVSKELVVKNGFCYTITNDTVSFEVNADNTKGYYVYIVVSNKAGTIFSKVYTKEIKARTISTQEEFYQLTQNGIKDNEIVLLTENLDFSDYKWVVKATTATISGLFNGLDHTISNLTISDEKNTKNINVFYKVTEGAIANVKFENIDLGQNKNATNAAIIGNMVGGYVKNVDVKNINAIALEAAGGLIGKISGKENYVSECSVINDNEHYIGTTKRYAGGIVGLVQRDTSESSLVVSITDCLVRATIGTNEDSSGYAGGIVGRGKNDVAGDYLLIERCIYSGKVTTVKDYAGGIIGGNDNGVGAVIIRNNISDCVIERAGTVYQYVERPSDYDPETWVDTVGHKGGSPITGRYTIPSGKGYYIFSNNYAPFADYNKEVASDIEGFYGRIQNKSFYINSLGLDLENVWYFDEVTKTINLR